MKGRIGSLLSWAAEKPGLAIGVTALIGIGVVGVVFASTLNQPQDATATVTKKSLVQEVDTTATVKAAESVDLAFGRSGRVAAVNAKAGDHVRAGAVIASLDTASLNAALAQAQGQLETQQAKLASLKSGTRPQQLSITQTSVAGAKTALTQAKQAELNTIQNAYIQADNAIHNQVDQFFVNPRTQSAALSFTVPNAVLQNKIVQERIALEPILNQWQGVVYGANFTIATDTQALANSAVQHLTQVSNFLDDVSQALAQTPSSAALPTATLQAYQTSVATARQAISGALSSLTLAQTKEQAAQTALQSAQGQLNLQQAGATSQDIAAQQAQVDVAKAAVAQAKAALSDAIIRAPVAGTVVTQNAHVGQTVSPGAPMVSFIADGKFEADAYVSQTDVAKIKLGDTVKVQLSAYTSSTSSPLDATVTSISPAATVTNGISSYKVTVTFAKNDPRLKDGLTANLRIITAKADNVLTVPSSAIIRNGNKAFVLVYTSGGGTEQVPVTTGITSATGDTQITSGLTAGERILAFGGTVQ